MIKQYLNNHKCLYKIINIMELIKHTYKMSPVTTLHLLCVFYTLFSQHLAAVSYSAVLASS